MVDVKQFDVGLGRDIWKSIEAAKEFARQNGVLCSFEFNGVNITVAADSERDLIYRDWDRGLRGYLGENPEVGPYPAPKLSDLDVASDEAMQAKRDAESARLSREWAVKAKRKQKTLDDLIASADPLDVTDPEAWAECVKNNQDAYGSAVIRYTETWGRIMQVMMSRGSTVEECAEETSHIADVEGITGFMYGCAANFLAQTWRHGEALRRWHNKETQLGTEGDEANESGGVLNPAMLRIGGDEDE